MTTRRRFLSTSLATLSAPAMLTHAARAADRPRVRAVAFDAFPIFDPRPIPRLLERLCPGNGDALWAAWTRRQFEYTWLRVSAKRYRDFWSVTQDALRFAAAQVGVELSDATREEILSEYRSLKPWDDVPEALDELRRRDLRLAFLSNMTHAMLEDMIRSSGLEGVFDRVISTDEARTYKPDPKAYDLGVERLGLQREEIVFVAFAGWDGAGASWYGYPTYWANRLGAPAEELGVRVDHASKSLGELPGFIDGLET